MCDGGGSDVTAHPGWISVDARKAFSSLEGSPALVTTGFGADKSPAACMSAVGDAP